MLSYIVLYIIPKSFALGDHPFGFHCKADDTEHAEEQTMSEHPDAEILFTYIGDSYADALDEYYTAGFDQ